LNFADRVAYQRAIEEVYWRHRIWPKENAGPKPPLDEVMSQAEIEKKVEDYLRNSQALEDYWQRPITPDQLQAEMERMASHTKQPGVLREIFAALGNDPFVIAECLARPVLAERLVRELYAHDQRFHGELRRRAEAELRMHQSVRQMKQTSGMYTEMEWIKSDATDTDSAPADTKSIEAVKMNGSEWQERVEKLAGEFGNAKTKDAWAQIRTDVLSRLQEDEGHYYAVAVMKKGKDRLKLATIGWLKEPLRSWLTRVEAQVPVTMASVSSANYTLPVISSASGNSSPSNSCTDDTWTATINAPDGRYYHTAVWTGSEMIVWGGNGDSGNFLNTGGRYNPSTDNWAATSTTNAPTGRYGHRAVWTGSEMIVWGGFADASYLNTGGKYNPSTDGWAATSNTNAPASRIFHTAVWTGTQMIVWGGYGDGGDAGYLNTGGKYNPSTDSWTATSNTNAPAGRYSHTAVWTGSQMIVWGGTGFLNTGGRYNPSTNSWTATSTTGAPAGRTEHTAVWTGSEMIVWGGTPDNLSYLNTGGRYNPSTNSWAATSTTGAPAGRKSHTAVWTGSQMIVWGGTNTISNFKTGGRYNPSTNSWAATSSIISAPDSRYAHTAVWTGTEMIIWGGVDSNGNYLNTGGRYSPSTDSWTATNNYGTPEARDSHKAVWTGSEMIVWGGSNGSLLNTGGRYNPTTDSWTATSTINAPAPRDSHTVVWTGSQMIVWGGYNGANTGGRYNPSTDGWIATSTTNAPSARWGHTAVWTGSQMIVWGGGSNGVVNTGGRYNPSTDSWTATSITNAPSARSGHTAVWTGSQMIVWGGVDSSGLFVNTGGRYTPSTDSWSAISVTSAPTGRDSHTAVWTGTEMIVWGGCCELNTGGRYNPSTNSWKATSTTSAPSRRDFHTAVWTGSEMIVWGGSGFLNTGGRYNPSADSWTATSTTSAPAGRTDHTAVWTGSQMIVWGGLGYNLDMNTGGRYCAVPPVVITTPATNVAAYSATLNGSVNPRGLTTTVHFQYGTTTSYGLNTANQSYTGSTYQNVSANISGLSASTTYHFRIVGTNSSGTYYGADQTFTTLSATGPPVVTTNPATYVASYSSALNGSVDPHGLTTTIYFQYGTTTSYGLTTAMQGQTGNTYQNVAANISGLSASTAYHFRIVATNSAGTKYGSDRTFTTLSATGPPVVITNPATYVASFSATLNGSVDPHGLTTTVNFQYGTTTSYGATTASQSKTGNTYQNVGVNISGLAASTTYHFRIVATNSAGTKYGSDRTFTTLSATGPPVVTTNPATNVTSSSATLNGTVDPHGLTTTVYFQYGTTTSYGHVTASQSKTGNTYQAVAANISGLSASTTYHFRIVATNSAGTVYGSDKTFTTL
jgi:N-acetylneuraminic acid mutarotase